MLAWQAIGISYVIIGLAIVWTGGKESHHSVDVRRAWALFAWFPPLLASTMGAHSAITALFVGAEKTNTDEDYLILAIVGVGIILSWILMSTGFAHMYQLLDNTSRAKHLAFPGQRRATTLDYLYFAFTIGTAFSTSDVQVTSLQARRIVLIHSVIGFLYNALVIAVAFQILQRLAGS